MGEIGMVLFKTKIQDGLQDYLNDYAGFQGCSIDVTDVVKENGTRTAVIVRKKDENMAPVIYLDSYYREFVSDGTSIEQILEEIAGAAVEGYRSYPFESEIRNIFNEKGNIICELVNTKWNSPMLKNVPHRNFEDLSLIYRKRIASNESATVLITNALAESMGMSEQQLYDAAMAGTGADNRYICVSMSDMLAKMMNMEPEDFPVPEEMEMYILTNESSMYGAAALIHEDMLSKAMEKLGTDNVIVIPSSIHEVIVIPGNVEPDAVRSMVREVNNTHVQENERLSNNIYRYDRKEKLRIVKPEGRSQEEDREAPDIQR